MFAPEELAVWAKVEGGQVVHIDQRMRISNVDFAAGDWRPVATNRHELDESTHLIDPDFVVEILADGSVLQTFTAVPLSPQGAARRARKQGLIDAG